MKSQADHRTDDIPVHEGILLDRDGSEIGGNHQQERIRQKGPAFRTRVFQPRGILAPITGILILALLMFAGITIVGFLFAAWAGYLIIRGILNLFSLGAGSPSRSRGGRYPMRHGS